MHQSSLDKMRAFRKKFLDGREVEALKILDLGSQDVNGSYKPFFGSPSWNYVGLDMSAGKNVDIVLADPYDWREVESSSVDVLVSGQAFEHIEFFWLTMIEIARVLKPGGLCCIIAPSGGYEHRYPVDWWRFYSDGFSALARFAQLDVLDVTMQADGGDYKDGSELWKDTMLICRKPADTSAFDHKAVKKTLKHYKSVERGKEKEAEDVWFNPLRYSKSLLQEPHRLTDPASWHEHTPFAFLIMQMLRPKAFVELGTHTGNSYLAFCPL